MTCTKLSCNQSRDSSIRCILITFAVALYFDGNGSTTNTCARRHAHPHMQCSLGSYARVTTAWSSCSTNAGLTYSAIIARYAPHCGSKCCNASINRTQGEGQILLDLRHSFFFLVKQVMICCPLISIPRTPYIILVLGSRSFDDDVGAVTTATNNAKPRVQ